jgi:carbon-monoxide dehydrogenase iron sulfur subunit
MGCGLCRVYCATEHSKSKDILKAHTREIPQPLTRIRIEKNDAISFSVQCRHCDEPWCVYSCLTGAMSQDPETGIVHSDPHRCIGCWTCIIACPYGALIRDKNNSIVAKCDFCNGREIPACVANCPNEALVIFNDNNLKSE